MLKGKDESSDQTDDERQNIRRNLGKINDFNATFLIRLILHPADQCGTKGFKPLIFVCVITALKQKPETSICKFIF